MNIRPARTDDLSAIIEIRNFHIQNTNSLFETEMETIQGRTEWFMRYSLTGPHRILVAEEKGQILGYASSSKYREGVAFSKTVEFSIFVAENSKSKGIGSSLYEALFEIQKLENTHCVVAGIALPNEASIALHKKFGFTEIGIFKEYAFKKEKYYSSLWLQKILGKETEI